MFKNGPASATASSGPPWPQKSRKPTRTLSRQCFLSSGDSGSCRASRAALKSDDEGDDSDCAEELAAGNDGGMKEEEDDEEAEEDDVDATVWLDASTARWSNASRILETTSAPVSDSRTLSACINTAPLPADSTRRQTGEEEEKWEVEEWEEEEEE